MRRRAERAPPPFVAEKQGGPRLGPLRSPGGFGLRRKEGAFLWCLRPRAGLGTDTLGVVSDPRSALSSESWVSAELSRFDPHGLRAEVARCLRLCFSPRVRGLSLVPSSRPRQPPRRNFVLLKGVDRAPVFSPYRPPSRPVIRRCSAPEGYASDSARLGGWGDAHSSCYRGPERFALGSRGLGGLCSFPPMLENALGWSHLRGISAYAGRSILGIAVTWILGLERANYWGNKTFKSVPSIPKNHRSPEKRISNDVWILPNSVCAARWGPLRVPERGLLSKLIRRPLQRALALCPLPQQVSVLLGLLD